MKEHQEPGRRDDAGDLRTQDPHRRIRFFIIRRSMAHERCDAFANVPDRRAQRSRLCRARQWAMTGTRQASSRPIGTSPWSFRLVGFGPPGFPSCTRWWSAPADRCAQISPSPRNDTPRLTVVQRLLWLHLFGARRRRHQMLCFGLSASLRCRSNDPGRNQLSQDFMLFFKPGDREIPNVDREKTTPDVEAVDKDVRASDPQGGFLAESLPGRSAPPMPTF